MAVTLKDLYSKLEDIKNAFGYKRQMQLDVVQGYLYMVEGYELYSSKHPYQCQCENCSAFATFESVLEKIAIYPFDNIECIYPTDFINFIKEIDKESKPKFKIEGQEFKLLEGFWNDKCNEYEHLFSVSTEAFRALNYDKFKVYKDFILLPFAKETMGFDDYGYLFFISKLNETSDGKVYYLDINCDSTKANLLADDFTSLLEGKQPTINDCLKNNEFVTTFLDNHQISFQEDKDSFFEIKEVENEEINTFLDANSCSLCLNNMNFGDGERFYFTTIYNSFTLTFTHNHKKHQLTCSFKYDDNVDLKYYQKKYEGYFFYESKDKPLAQYAQIKLRLKMILCDSLFKTADFLTEKNISFLDILTDEHLQELEKAFTMPVEIDYYED